MATKIDHAPHVVTDRVTGKGSWCLSAEDHPAAPTITIDGVTSNPGHPVTMTELICGDHPILNGHNVKTGDEVNCPECQTPVMVVSTFETWVF